MSFVWSRANFHRYYFRYRERRLRAVIPRTICITDHTKGPRDFSLTFARDSIRPVAKRYDTIHFETRTHGLPLTRSDIEVVPRASSCVAFVTISNLERPSRPQIHDRFVRKKDKRSIQLPFPFYLYSIMPAWQFCQQWYSLSIDRTITNEITLVRFIFDYLERPGTRTIQCDHIFSIK